MELEEALKKAAEIVERAKLPQDLRAPAFERALESLMGTAGGAPRHAPADAKHPIAPASSESAPLSAIAAKLGISEDAVAETFDVKDGNLDVVLGYSKLATGTAAGARQLALLVAAGRQAAGLDPDGWTATAEIRAICKEFGKFDEANFGATIAKMHQPFSFSGSGASRKVKMTRAGWEQAKQLVEELTA